MMDILYQRGRATAAEIHERLADPPSYSAVRAKLRVLEEKGHIRHETQAPATSIRRWWRTIGERIGVAAPARHVFRQLGRTGGDRSAEADAGQVFTGQTGRAFEDIEQAKKEGRK